MMIVVMRQKFIKALRLERRYVLIMTETQITEGADLHLPALDRLPRL